MSHSLLRASFIVAVTAMMLVNSGNTAADEPAQLPSGKKLFDDRNLVAWCIVPFDAANRTPAQRAEMLKRLSLKHVAYDWRAKHVAEFEEEILQYKKHGIEYFAFWGVHDEAFKLFNG